MSRYCVFSFMTHYLHTYRHINSVWLLVAGMRLWFMVFRLPQTSTLIGWGFKWTLRMLSTPFRVRPFSKSFRQHETNYHNFFLLFVFFMPQSLLYFLVIISFQEIYSSSFRLLACTKLILLLDLSLLLPTFMFCVPFLRFFLLVFSLLWLDDIHILNPVLCFFYFLSFHFPINIHALG